MVTAVNRAVDPAVDPAAGKARAIAETVVDPELPMLTLADLGVLRDVSEVDGRVTVTITPTYLGCPALAEIRTDLDRALRQAGFEPEIRTALRPPWTSDWITEHGRAKLAEAGIAPPGTAPKRVMLTLAPPPAAVRCPNCGSPDTEELSRFAATACLALRRCRGCAEPFEHVKEI